MASPSTIPVRPLAACSWSAVRPFEAVARRQGCGRDALHRRQSLAGTVTELCCAVHNRAAESVVAHHRLRPLHELCFSQGADGDLASLCVAHVDAVDIIDVIAKRRLCLDIDLPGTSERVEVVDVVAAQCGL